MTAPQDDEGRLDRVATIPNAISLLRLMCVPVFLWLLFGRENRLGAALLLGGLGATDWVDGYIARHFDQVSNLGKVLDPIADKVLLVVGMVAILIDGSVPAIIAIPAIVREAAVSLAVIVLAAMGARRIDVTWWGKAGTFLMMTAFPLFLASNDDEFAAADVVGFLGWACGIVGLLVSYYAAFRYIPLGRQALREGGGRKVGSGQ